LAKLNISSIYRIFTRSTFKFRSLGSYSSDPYPRFRCTYSSCHHKLFHQFLFLHVLISCHFCFRSKHLLVENAAEVICCRCSASAGLSRRYDRTSIWMLANCGRASGPVSNSEYMQKDNYLFKHSVLSTRDKILPLMFIKSPEGYAKITLPRCLD